MNKEEEEEEENYSPYCPHCESCGETGCCSPTICHNHPDGRYCVTNMSALKVSHKTLTEFWDTIDEKKYPEVLKLLNEIYDKHDDAMDEHLKTKNK